jgi:penicillin-binding protein 1A
VRAADIGGALLPPAGDQRAPRVIREANAWIITDLLREVIRSGTGQRARALGRGDIAGKTGTTNDGRDAWFSGFNADLAATAWVGFDQERPLGADEEGARTALPMWIYFMREALAGAGRGCRCRTASTCVAWIPQFADGGVPASDFEYFWLTTCRRASRGNGRRRAIAAGASRPFSGADHAPPDRARTDVRQAIAARRRA